MKTDQTVAAVERLLGDMVGEDIGDRPNDFSGTNDPQWWDENAQGYNSALSDIRSRIPETSRKVVELLEKPKERPKTYFIPVVDGDEEIKRQQLKNIEDYVGVIISVKDCEIEIVPYDGLMPPSDDGGDNGEGV